jgi:hypothetical protein
VSELAEARSVTWFKTFLTYAEVVRSGATSSTLAADGVDVAGIGSGVAVESTAAVVTVTCDGRETVGVGVPAEQAASRTAKMTKAIRDLFMGWL